MMLDLIYSFVEGFTHQNLDPREALVRIQRAKGPKPTPADLSEPRNLIATSQRPITATTIHPVGRSANLFPSPNTPSKLTK